MGWAGFPSPCTRSSGRSCSTLPTTSARSSSRTTGSSRRRNRSAHLVEPFDVTLERDAGVVILVHHVPTGVAAECDAFSQRGLQQRHLVSYQRTAVQGV